MTIELNSFQTEMLHVILVLLLHKVHSPAINRNSSRGLHKYDQKYFHCVEQCHLYSH